jgi:Lhr-like helicase
MPFWHGDRPGRPLEFGQAIGKLARELTKAPRKEAAERLTEKHGLDRRAASNLLAYLHEQAAATGEVPSDSTDRRRAVPGRVRGLARLRDVAVGAASMPRGPRP